MTSPVSTRITAHARSMDDFSVKRVGEDTWLSIGKWPVEFAICISDLPREAQERIVAAFRGNGK